eukprot:SAG11_NODE_317_length_10836_cov_7.445469_4_plen_48_part_00
MELPALREDSDRDGDGRKGRAQLKEGRRTLEAQGTKLRSEDIVGAGH